MPEVGVLNLTIHDNSKTAATGLNALANALTSAQNALGNGLKLSNTSRSLNSFAKAINSNAPALAKVGTFLNAITDYSKAFNDTKNIKFNRQPIDELKEAIGDGIKLGQAGTQINNIKAALGEGWDTKSSANIKTVLTDIAEGARAFTGVSLATVATGLTKMGKGMLAYAEGAERLKNVVGSKTVSAMRDYGEITKQLMSDRDASGRTSLLKPNLQFHAGQGSDFEDTKEQIREMSQEYKNYVGNIEELKYKQLDVMSIMDTPLEHLHDIYRTLTTSTEDYKNATGAALPKVQEMSSAEMLVAGNAREATKAIGAMLNRLNKVENPTGKGFNNIVDIVSGVARQNTSLASESAKEFEKLFEQQSAYNKAVENVDTTKAKNMVLLFDSVNGGYKKVEGPGEKAAEASETIKNVINLLNVPSSGKNGVFANAGEELTWLNEKLAESRKNLEFWSTEYSKIQRSIKYNGSTETRENALTHAEEGFYSSYADMDRYNSSISSLLEYSKEYVNTTTEAIAVSNQQADSLKNVADSANSAAGGLAEMISSAQGNANSVAIQQIFDTLNRTPDVKFADIVDNVNGVDRAFMSAEESMNAFLEGMNQPGDYAAYIRELNPELAEVADKFTNAAEAAREYKNELAGTKASTMSFGKSIKSLFPTLSGLIKRMGNMAVMRGLRYMIRHLASGFSEGVQNVYQYSKIMGTSLAPAMDQAATALQQMKNSIGAAVAPAIQALVPVLQTVANWFINLVNYANQFFALLRGQSTWTKALPESAEAFEKQKQKAKGASKAMKDLLADWDELNIIQNKNNSGGGSGTGHTTEEYKNMFEEVSKFDDSLKKFVETLKDQFGDVWGFVKRIGTAVLGWKVSKAFAGTIGTLGALIGSAATIGLVFDITTVTDKMFLKTGDAGWLVASILTPLIGGLFMKKILGKVLKGQFAKVAIPITFGVSAIADIVTNIGENDTSAISKESLGLSATSALKTGAAAAYLAFATQGHSLKASLAGGAAIAIATFGAVVGIKATIDAVKSGVTIDTVKSVALSSLALGIGTAWFATLSGVSTATAVALGAVAAGATIATISAVIGISALLALVEEHPVQWGNYEASAEQIRDFVKGKVFEIDAETILSLMNPKVEVAEEKAKDLTATVDEVSLIAKKINIGINEKETLDELKKKVFGEEGGEAGLIGKFRETAKAYQNVIETGITLVPTTGTDEFGQPKDIIDKSSQGWTMLTTHMDNLGTELSKHMAEAYKENISKEAKAMELETISELTQMMANVSAAMARGEGYEQAIQNLVNNIHGMTRGSWDKLFSFVEEYKKEITKNFATTYDETTRYLSSQRAGIQESIKNEQTLADKATTTAERNKHLAYIEEYKKQYQYLTDQINARRAGRTKAIEDATKNALNEETVESIRQALSDLISSDPISADFVPTIPAFVGQRLRKQMWNQLFNENGTTNTYAKDTVETWLWSMIDDAFGTDANTVEDALRNGFLGYGDIIGKDVIDALANEIGIGGQSKEIQKAWSDLVNDLFYGGEKKYEFVAPPVDTSNFDTGMDNMIESAEQAVSEIDQLFGGVQDRIFASDSVHKQEYLEQLVNLYDNNQLDEIRQLIKFINQNGVEGGFSEFNKSRSSAPNMSEKEMKDAEQLAYKHMFSPAFSSYTTPAYTPSEPVKTEPKDPQQEINDTASGTKKGTEEILTEVRSAVSQLTRLLAKEWNITITPDADWGRHNAKSQEQLEASYGNN